MKRILTRLVPPTPLILLAVVQAVAVNAQSHRGRFEQGTPVCQVNDGARWAWDVFLVSP
jgi:hypothetical protein